MCTCAILSLLRLVIDMSNMIVDILKIRQNELRMYLEGPVPKALTAPLALVDIVCCLVTDHTRCRKRFAVQSHEHPPGRKTFGSHERPPRRRRSVEGDKGAVTEDAP